MTTINKAVSHSVTLGTAPYGSVLGITPTGTNDRTLAGAVGIHISTRLATTTILLADLEREPIRTRTAESRSRAKTRGQHMV